jgi:2-oxoisovalerate ferredoxin oxidoreductase delta subunit
MRSPEKPDTSSVRRSTHKVVYSVAEDFPLLAVSEYDMSYNKTGSWRNVRPALDIGKCIYCTNCWKFCPEPAIHLEPVEIDGRTKGKPVIDYDYCKGCGICWTECPTGAIQPESEGK